MNDKELELLKLALELESRKSIVGKASDLVVETVEAPFKIAGRLFNDLFNL